MNLKNIYEDGQMYYKSVWNLYEKAFPKEEQKSVEIMELLKDQGKMEISLVCTMILLFLTVRAVTDLFAI